MTFAGGVLAYLVFIPLIHFFGDGLSTPLLSPDGALIRDMGPDELHRTYVLYIGAGAVATGGLISLLRSLPAIVRAFQRSVRTFLACAPGPGGGRSADRAGPADHRGARRDAAHHPRRLAGAAAAR